jgi:cellulose synthase/poly-beta-1,6-N-acetylglucosamine synthase-like glycosyltransferase
MVSEKRWIAAFVVVAVVWFVILFTTLYQWANGIRILVDNSIDLTYVTLPLIAFPLTYTFISIFVFSVYLLTFNKVKARQHEKILMAQEQKQNQHVLNINQKGHEMISSPVPRSSLSDSYHSAESSVRIPTSHHNLFPRSLAANSTANNYDSNINQRGVDTRGTTNNNIKEQENSYGVDDLCSVIIPSKNEEHTIRKTIQNCLLQTYRNIEILVICHNCSDKTFEEAVQVKDSRVHALNLTTKEAGKGLALNYGIENAKGKYILILDGDGRSSNGFIEKALPLFLEEDIAAVQGRYIPSNRNYNLITRLLSIEGDLWSTPFMTTRSFLNKKVYLGGTGFIIRKDVLIKVGKFANHLVDDYELSCRLFKMNYKVLFAPLSTNYDEKPPSLSIMLRQRARWARGFLSLLRTRAVKVSDIIGYMYWLAPLASLSGLLVLGIFGYAAFHGAVFEFYPYKYAYIPLNLWFVLIGLLSALQSAVLVKQYGWKGLRYAAYLVIFNPFSLYILVAFLKGLFVKSWGDTKTVHGFVTETDLNE